MVNLLVMGSWWWVLPFFFFLFYYFLLILTFVLDNKCKLVVYDDWVITDFSMWGGICLKV